MNIWKIVIVTISILVLGTSFLFVEGLQTISLHYKNFYYVVDYNATDGITIESANVSEPLSPMVFSLKVENEGNISINIPYALMQTRYKCQPAGIIDAPLVLINGTEVDFTIIENPEQQTMSLTIPISKETTELEFSFTADMGAWAFPDGCPIELFENAIPYTTPEFEKTYEYSDGYGYHIIPYKLPDGEITQLDCSRNGLTVHIKNSQSGKMELIVPKSLLDLRGSVNIDITTNNGYLDYQREPFQDSLKLIINVGEGTFPIRVQTSVYSRECVVGPSENDNYRLYSPKTQLDNNIPPQRIICKNGEHILVFKNSDHLPACVRQQTAKKLVERGLYDNSIWIKIRLSCNVSGCIMPSWLSLELGTEYPIEQFTSYFKSKNIHVLNTKTSHISSNTAFPCEWGECGESWIDFSFQIFEKDFDKIVEDGFVRE
jgi:hypothetical protein